MSRSPVALVMAKAPVPGQVKTRLAADIGDHEAAALASAALLDTLDACEAAFGVDRCVLALAGDLAAAVDGAELARRLSGWAVHAQRGDGLAARLVNAHRDAGAEGSAVVQVGMDTPQLRAEDLTAVAALLGHGDDRADGPGSDAVLGPAEDGGWWVLAVRRARWAEALAEVPMSTERTCADTERALRGEGATVALAHRLRDVDTLADAALVAAARPGSRFARAWEGLR